jgi:dTDP-4-amino-4,6-dideoxygalactose transaminase
MEIDRSRPIVLPTLSFPSILAPFMILRLKIKFHDIEPEILNIDTKRLQDRHGIIVHNYGLPVDGRGFLIEDACAALGGSYLRIPCGKMGKVSILSFGHQKILPLGRGGMVLTDDPDLAEKIRGYSSYGLIRVRKTIDHFLPGLNLKMDEETGKEGIEGFKLFKNRIKLLRELKDEYTSAISDLVGLPKILPGAQPAPDRLILKVMTHDLFTLIMSLRRENFDASPLDLPLTKIRYIKGKFDDRGAMAAVRTHLQIRINPLLKRGPARLRKILKTKGAGQA